MSDRSDTMTADYADGIVRTLAALEELSAHDHETLMRLAEADSDDLEAGEELAELELSDAALSEFEDLSDAGYLENVDGRPVEAWLNSVLDITLRASRSLGAGQFQVDEVEVLVTCGGPDARVTFDGGSALVRVFWGSGRTERRVHAPAVNDAVWSLVEAYGY